MFGNFGNFVASSFSAKGTDDESVTKIDKTDSKKTNAGYESNPSTVSAHYNSYLSSSDTNARKEDPNKELWKKEHLEKLKQNVEELKADQQLKDAEIRDTVSKLDAINTTKGKESKDEDILKTLRKCIKSFDATEKNWVALVNFFGRIDYLIEKGTEKVGCCFQLNYGRIDAHRGGGGAPYVPPNFFLKKLANKNAIKHKNKGGT